MRNVLIVTLLILAGSSLSAQNDEDNQLKATLAQKETQMRFAIAQAADSCPIGFQANLSGRAMVRSADNAKKDSSADVLELSFTALKTPSIKNARIIVHGLSRKNRLLPVYNLPAEDALQAFQLHRLTSSTSLDQADVWITKITAAQWVEIADLDYEDGSSWHASRTSVCHVKLSGIKLVDADIQ